MTPTPTTWARHFRATAHRVNWNIWLASFLPLCLVATLAGAVLVLILRSLGQSGAALYAVPISLFLVAFAAPLLRIRSRFWTTDDARTRLDLVLPLHTRLSSAAEGVGEWPIAPERVDDGFRFAPGRRLLGPISGLMLLAAAYVVPLDPGRNRELPPTTGPRAWSALEESLSAIEEPAVVEEAPLQAFRQELQHLKQSDPKTWFSANSLEASANLEARLKSAAEALREGLFSASQALDQAGNAAAAGEAGTADLASAASAISESTAGLLASGLPLNPELANALAQLADPAAWKNLDPGQLEALKKQLGDGIQGCRACLGPIPGNQGNQGDGERGGNGGVDRGPGHAPLAIGPPSNLPDPTITGPIQSNDLSRSAIGDVLETKRTAPQSEIENPALLQSGGVLGDAGSGGDAVHRPDVTPAESELLQRYFQ